jgi:glycosyltransferase involved in cell wall biosynthesis
LNLSGHSLSNIDHIASVCTIFPSERNPEAGIFVARRLGAMAERVSLRAIRPIPWFPVVRPVQNADLSLKAAFSISDRKMFYIPAVLKHLDGMWLARTVEPLLKSMHQRGELDVIDAHFGFPDGVGCYQVGKKLGVPVFITIRGVEQDEIRDPKIGPLMVDALSNCAGVIAVSESLKRAAVERGVPASQIRVITNATDESRFHVGDRTEARKELGLPLDRKLVISVGFLNERKGQHRLIPAFAKMRQHVQDAILILIGDGTYNEPAYVNRLHEQVRSLGIADCVKFIGAVSPDRIGDWLRAGDLFALATRREGRCNALLEALACGLPAVTTPAGDNAAMVDPPRNGRIVDVDDQEAMAQALVDVAQATWDRQQIASSVPARTWNDVAVETLKYMEEQLQGIRSQPHSRQIAVSANVGP